MGQSQAVYFNDRILKALKKYQKMRGGSFSFIVNLLVEAGFKYLQENKMTLASVEAVRAHSVKT